MFPFQDGFLAQHFQNQVTYNFLNQPSSCFYDFNYQWNQQSQLFNAPIPYSIFSRINNDKLPAQRSADSFFQQGAVKVKKKRMTKKLVAVNVKSNIRQSTSFYKSVKKSLSYFDPSRAPPITTLRTKLQLEKDLQLNLTNAQVSQTGSISQNNEQQSNLMKLSILIKAPSQTDYPFLICKKRKYYRNLKRRYSVAYFNERGYYISNRLPMPAKLEPKHKNRRNRQKNKSSGIDSSESFSDIRSQQSNSFEEERPVGADSQRINADKGNQGIPLKVEQVKRQTFSPCEEHHL